MNSKVGKTGILIDVDPIKINMTDLDPSCKLAIQKTLLLSDLMFSAVGLENELFIPLLQGNGFLGQIVKRPKKLFR